MSIVLDEVCKALKLDGDAKAKETVAVCIIRPARRGECSPQLLRDRFLQEFGLV
jgi:hypothetical protein